MRWPLESRSLPQARAWWQRPAPRPEVTPRLAATVALVRESADARGIEVFVLRRHASMAFAPGAVVFAGGGVDRSDGNVARAAVRELFEETGVLLASDEAGAFPDTGTPSWEARRLAVVARSQVLDDELADLRLGWRTDLLLPWSRWVTPRYLPARYDTSFFVAQVPAGQRARHVVGEAVESRWARPVDLLAGNELMRPTRQTLLDLGECTSWADLVAAAERRREWAAQPQLSELVVDDGRFYLEHDLPGPR